MRIRLIIWESDGILADHIRDIFEFPLEKNLTKNGNLSTDLSKLITNFIKEIDSGLYDRIEIRRAY